MASLPRVVVADPRDSVLHSGGYSTRAVISVMMAGLLPLGLGHTLYNAALRRTYAIMSTLSPLKK